MEKPISRKAHGLLELTNIPLTAFAPELFGFKDNTTASLTARITAGLMLGSALMARSEWGLFKVVPFKKHLRADAGLSAFALLSPWMAKFNKNRSARNAFLFIGVTGLVLGALLTQKKEM